MKHKMVLLVGTGVKGAVEKRVCEHCGHVQLRARNLKVKALKCKKCGREMPTTPAARASSKGSVKKTR